MNIKNDSINEFFSSLSKRGNENYLSDIIATGCNVSFTFKKIFLEFMFPNDNIMKKCPSEIEREVSVTKGRYRFDLYFTTSDNLEYVIENKIYDKNDHYKEYSKIINPTNLGIIVNYEITDDIKYKNKHTWKEFYNHVREINTSFSPNEKYIIEGLMNYIKGTCNIMNKRNFKLNNLRDLGYIISILKEILDAEGFEIISKAKGSSERRIGFWVYKKTRTFWFGISLNEETGFSFNGGLYNYNLNNKHHNNLKYSNLNSTKKDDNCLWFELKQDNINKLCNNSLDYDKKYTLIKNFINEIGTID